MAASAPLKDYRNRSFKGQDLSGRDFSGCDLRGCDFRDAKLQRVDFSGSRFGQTAKQRIKLIAVAIIACIGVIILGANITLAFVGYDVSSFTTVAYTGFTVVAGALVFSLFVPSAFLIVMIFGGSFSFTFIFAAAVFKILSALNRGVFLEGILWLVVAAFSGVPVFLSFQLAIDEIKYAPGTRFGGADLTGAIFVNTKLDNCNFGNVGLYQQVNWTGAIFKRSTKMRLNSSLMELLTFRKGNGGNYCNNNFSNLHMAGIDLSQAVLNNSNLSRANLQHADLQDASLVNVQASGTDFRHAKLTGVCIQKWSVNTDTQFDDVICDHVFLQCDADGQKFDRRPSSGSFLPGEFAELVHKFTNTLDILFREDINPTAFALALERLQAHGELNFSGVENLSVGQLYRFKVADDFPKEQAHEELTASYEETKLKLRATEEKVCYLQSSNQDLASKLTDAEKALIAAHDKHNNFLQQLVFRQVDQFSRPMLNAPNSIFTGDPMSDKSTNPKIQAGGDAFYVGGDNSGVVGKDQTGVAGGDISGSLTLTLDQLKQSPEPEAQTLAEHLKTLKTAIEAKDAGLSDDRKTKALDLLTKLTKLATTPDKSSPAFLEQASDTIEDLDNIVKKGSGLADFAEKHLPTIMTGIRFCMGLTGMS